MTDVPDPVARIAILVGVIEPVFRRVVQRIGPGLVIRPIFMAKNDYRLVHPPRLATAILEQHADEATSYADVVILVLPFFRRPRELQASVDTLSDLGAQVTLMRQGMEGCPTLKGRMDAEFQCQLAAAIIDCISRLCPTEMAPSRLFSSITEYQVAFDLLRGLASHDKMGSNNHSHEDDMWKGCGIGLRPNARHGIAKRLMTAGILARKKNKSKGGTGWVYWIADVQRTVFEFPSLRDIINGVGDSG